MNYFSLNASSVGDQKPGLLGQSDVNTLNWLNAPTWWLLVILALLIIVSIFYLKRKQ